MASIFAWSTIIFLFTGLWPFAAVTFLFTLYWSGRNQW